MRFRMRAVPAFFESKLSLLFASLLISSVRCQMEMEACCMAGCQQASTEQLCSVLSFTANCDEGPANRCNSTQALHCTMA